MVDQCSKLGFLSSSKLGDLGSNPSLIVSAGSIGSLIRPNGPYWGQALLLRRIYRTLLLGKETVGPFPFHIVFCCDQLQRD